MEAGNRPIDSNATGRGSEAPRPMGGEKVMGIIRSSFLFDERGEIVEVWHKVSREETVPKGMPALKGD